MLIVCNVCLYFQLLFRVKFHFYTLKLGAAEKSARQGAHDRAQVFMNIITDLMKKRELEKKETFELIRYVFIYLFYISIRIVKYHFMNFTNEPKLFLFFFKFHFNNLRRVYGVERKIHSMFMMETQQTILATKWSADISVTG